MPAQTPVPTTQPTVSPSPISELVVDDAAPATLKSTPNVLGPTKAVTTVATPRIDLPAAIFRGSIGRIGFYDTEGVAGLDRLKWKFTLKCHRIAEIRCLRIEFRQLGGDVAVRNRGKSVFFPYGGSRGRLRG